jgi:hypothetical protein
MAQRGDDLVCVERRIEWYKYGAQFENRICGLGRTMLSVRGMKKKVEYTHNCILYRVAQHDSHTVTFLNPDGHQAPSEAVAHAIKRVICETVILVS